MKLDGLKRLVREDFPDDSKALVDKLAFVLNPYLEGIATVLNHNIDYDNLKRELKTIDVVVNASGNPIPAISFRNTLSSKIKGINVIRAQNNTSTTVYPTATPFITFTEENKIITINNISGLQLNNKYSLTIETIG